MKHIDIFVVLLAFFLVSCSDTDRRIPIYPEISLKSEISGQVFTNVSLDLARKINLTRADGSIDLTESEAQTMLEPFIEDGRNLRQSLLSQIDVLGTKSGFASQDIYTIENMTDDELALFSFVIYGINQDFVNSRATLSSRALSCLEVATGISAIRGIGVSGLVNAKTVTQVLRALGSRYLGYIGVGLMICSFADCVS